MSNVGKTFFFTLLVVVGLQSLRFMPTVRVGGRTLRRVDLLSSVRPDKSGDNLSDRPVVADSMTAMLDSMMIVGVGEVPVGWEDDENIVEDDVSSQEYLEHTSRIRHLIVVPEDTADVGFTRIEEFPDSTGEGGMSHFYDAMANIDSLDRPVRIAYFGDSFIEGDILTADLRSMLQKKFGGCGVGYVPLVNRNPNFRPTVVHSYKGWIDHTVTDKQSFDEELQDIYCRYFVTEGSGPSSVTLQGQRRYASRLDTCELSSFFFVASDTVTVRATINNKDEETFTLLGDSAVRCLTVNGRIGKVEWTVERADSSSRFFAATMDGNDGIVLDNFNIRASNGLNLANIPMSVLKAYNSMRHYDLIVLHYGLNIAADKPQNYSYYTNGMARVIRKLKRAFPDASILIVSVSDREIKDEETGELRTMYGVLELMEAQRQLAVQTNTAFWNLFEAMGGEGSIREMTEGEPQMANYDYTHINFRGGRHLAAKFYEAIAYGCQRYKNYAEHENENKQNDDI